MLIVMSLVVSFFWRGLMRVRTRVLIQVSRRGIVDDVLGLSGGNELSGFFVCIFVRQVVIVCLSLSRRIASVSMNESRKRLHTPVSHSHAPTQTTTHLPLTRSTSFKTKKTLRAERMSLAKSLFTKANFLPAATRRKPTCIYHLKAAQPKASAQLNGDIPPSTRAPPSFLRSTSRQNSVVHTPRECASPSPSRASRGVGQ